MQLEIEVREGGRCVFFSAKYRDYFNIIYKLD